MNIDLDAAKDALPLPSLMAQLGLGAHAKVKAHCPWHDDRNESFSVFQNGGGRWYFKCWAGCGDKGDEISFLEKHLGLSKRDAIRRYGELAGVTETLSSDVNGVATGGRRGNEGLGLKASSAIQLPVKSPDTAQNFRKVTARPLNEAEVAQVAQWRGFPPAFVAEMSAAGVLAVCDGKHIGFRAGKGWHYRIGGKPGEKPSWRYSDGEKASVLVLGDPKAGAELTVCESSWDALSFYCALRMPVVCTRGAGNHRLAIEFINDNDLKRVVVVPQNDGPGIQFAQNIAKELNGTCEVADMFVPPPHKDIAAWKQAGATDGAVLSAYMDAKTVENTLSGGPVTESASAHSGDGCSSGAQPKGISHPPPAQSLPLPQILDKLTAFLTTYVIFPMPEQATVCALWVAHAWVFKAFRFSAYLHVCSPEKRCGKSRLLECIELVVPRPRVLIRPSEAVLFRTIENEAPTLLLDEIDTVFSATKDDNAEGLRAVLNAGFQSGAKVPRCVGNGHEIAEFSVFCPKLISGIGRIPDTVHDRSIDIKLNRQTSEHKAARFRLAAAETEAKPMRDALGHWSPMKELSEATPHIPDGLTDRQADMLEPLLAIAELAGPEWAERGRNAIVALCSTGEDQSVGIQLLSSCREVFADKDTDWLTFEDLLSALIQVKDANAPWPTWWERDVKNNSFGGPSNKLARMLEPYGIKPTTMDDDKGYRRAAFSDAFTRYLPTLTMETKDLF